MESRGSFITLGASDFQRSLKFYRDGLGFPLSSASKDDVAFFKLDEFLPSPSLADAFGYVFVLCHCVPPNRRAGRFSKDYSIEREGILGVKQQDALNQMPVDQRAAEPTT